MFSEMFKDNLVLKKTLSKESVPAHPAHSKVSITKNNLLAKQEV